MVAITALSYATPPSQVLQDRSRVAQARQQADQAEAQARQLRSQADQAEQDAASDQARVGALTARAAQSDSTYRTQLQQQIASKAARQTQTVLAPVSAAAANQFAFPANPLQSASQGWTASLQRPASGRLLNQSA